MLGPIPISSRAPKEHRGVWKIFCQPSDDRRKKKEQSPIFKVVSAGLLFGMFSLEAVMIPQKFFV